MRGGDTSLHGDFINKGFVKYTTKLCAFYLESNEVQ